MNPRAQFSDLLSAIAAARGPGPRSAVEGMLGRIYPGARSIDFNYGRAALQHLFRELGLRGKRVAMPAYACGTLGRVCLAEGVEPVFVDVEPATYTISPRALEAALARDVAAVIAIHTFGNPCDLDALARLRSEHGFILVEDCAHALGATFKGNPVGRFGEVALLSMYKTLPNVSGAVLIINEPGLALAPPPPAPRDWQVDAALAANLLPAAESRGVKWAKRRLVRLLRRTERGAGVVEGALVPAVRASPLALSLFAQGLPRALDGLEGRRAIAKVFLDRLKRVGRVTPQAAQPGSSWMNLAVTVDEGIDRDRVLERMLERGIVCDRIWHEPVVALPDVQAHFGVLLGDFHSAAELSRTVLNLPLGSGLTLDDVDGLVDALSASIDEARRPAWR